MDWNEPLSKMRSNLTDYIQKNRLKSLVLGVSGGIDSALVAAIVRPVCDSIGIKLIGRSLPNTTNKPDEISRATDIGEALCHDFKTISINEQFSILHGQCEKNYSEKEDLKFNKIAEGNIKARVRMVHLYDLAYRNRGLVLGTDNFTELLLGFWTLHGDEGDYGLIQNLWKTEVYDLSRWIYDCEGTKEILPCVEAIPTDGLGITNSDLEQLGASSYEEVDKILKTWLTKDKDSFLWDTYLKYPERASDWESFEQYRDSLKDHPVVQRNRNSEFKRNNPFNIPRNNILTEV